MELFLNSTAHRDCRCRSKLRLAKITIIINTQLIEQPWAEVLSAGDRRSPSWLLAWQRLNLFVSVSPLLSLLKAREEGGKEVMILVSHRRRVCETAGGKHAPHPVAFVLKSTAAEKQVKMLETGVVTPLYPYTNSAVTQIQQV